MKRHHHAAFPATFAIALCTFVTAAQAQSVDAVSGVHDWMQSLVDEERVVGCSAMITQGGETIFLDAFGDRSPESVEELTTDQIVRIYSMSKAITSTAIMQLVEQGKLGIDDPVSLYIPEFAEMNVGLGDDVRPALRQITIRDLLTHTSGLAYDFSAPGEFKPVYAAVFENTPTLEEAAAAIGGLPLVCEVGSRFQYGLSTDVLGRVVEVVSNQSFGDYLRQNIFVPLGMEDTSFVQPDDMPTMPIVTGNKGSLHVDTAFYEAKANRALKPRFESGGGGLWSTLHDYTRFMQAMEQYGELDGNRILKARTVAFMTYNQLSPAYESPQQFGLGFGFYPAMKTSLGPRGDHRWSWGGAANTYFFIDPKQDLTAIFITQKFPFDGMMAEEFTRVVLEGIAIEDAVPAGR